MINDFQFSPLGVVLRSESEDLRCAEEIVPLAGEWHSLSVGELGTGAELICSSKRGDLG